MAKETELAEGDVLVDLSKLVKFKADYPKDYAGVKYLKQDKVYSVHELVGKRLESKKVGKIQ